jgi:hypothetical protein
MSILLWDFSKKFTFFGIPVKHSTPVEECSIALPWALLSRAVCPARKAING